MERICVAVRMRPRSSEESSSSSSSCGTFWKIHDNRVSLHRIHGTPVSSSYSYAFDHVFDETCSSARVYDLLTKDIIHAAVSGFNGTVFAYGQTSSGKTYTMNGSEADPGIIRLAVRDVFGEINKMSEREFLIRVSYMEIYNEEINDLLAVENQKLQIHESLERGIYVAGLREEIVSNSDQVLKLIEAGEVNRHFGETNMNARSSRSHTIFRMVIESKGKDNFIGNEHGSLDSIRVSVLNLVDLAGSERVAKTGAGGVRLKEGKYINKSLMALGNVINKLSEGVKQRGHIPYRDSKLTRILQPALGGNTKTSIICTVAPEEIHVEETKGTLQFASRAKRITNCAQVNEILTDAALLKRQKLEIEELRRKLQGSHAEVLEQEILKLRNGMLKYELERERLEMELEEERKLHKERVERIREQHMKIDSFSLQSSDCDGDSSLGHDSATEISTEDLNDSNNIVECDSFRTPSLKTVPSSFVVRRSNYSRIACSPLPDALSNVADEETWLQMNNGYVANLDALRMTPARNNQDCPSKTFEEKLQDLKKQLEVANEEKNKLENEHMEQVQMNQQLLREISDLQEKVRVYQEVPQRLSESVSNCKDAYSEIFTMMKSFVDSSSTGKLLSNANDIGNILFSSLETHLSMSLEDETSYAGSGLSLEQQEAICQRLKCTVNLLASKAVALKSRQLGSCSCSCHREDCDLGVDTDSPESGLIAGLNAFKEKYHVLREELNESARLLQDSKDEYSILEREFQKLKEERDCLRQAAYDSDRKISSATVDRENVLKELNMEVCRRKKLEEQIKSFSKAFAARQTSVVSLQSNLRMNMEKLMAKTTSVTMPKPLGD
ncbi:hypothetical protein MLD38_024709 [Melastoma candidum]|uniref:Uncharacterized protein n=1 Tax=Melastoma candidum TaxID=119954 RepID=A0ACB9NT41_9MYRT|nr:hypothetical protein MLD38_024709 [Melastoma candidum]